MFGEDEEKFYMWFRGAREPLVLPIVDFFARLGMKPETLTYIGLAMMVPFVYFFSFHPWIAFPFLLLQMFFDGLDGSLARKLGTSSARGAFLDVTADYVSFVVVFFTCLYFGLLHPFWAAAHVLNYAVMQAFVFFGRTRSIAIFPVIRPKLIFYFVLLVWLVSGQNYFDPFLVVSSVYLMVTNFFLFLRIRWSL